MTWTRHLAQANVARQRAPLDAPEMAGFVVALDPVNRVAEASPGFVWRLRSGEAHGATVLEDRSSPMIVNLSVWESYEALHAFVYRSPHGGYLRRRARWSLPGRRPSAVDRAVVGRGGRAAGRRRGLAAPALPAGPRPFAPGLHSAAQVRAGRPAGAPARAQPALRSSLAARPAVVVRERKSARSMSCSSL